jgi:hypothetical protein
VGSGGCAEGDVLDSNGDGVCFGGAGFGVFAHSKEVIESNVGEVGSGFPLGTVLWVGPVLVKQVLGDADGHCKLRG